MTDTAETSAIVRLGRDSAAYALGGALARAVNILLLPVYTALIPPREFGALATLLLVAAVVTPIVTLGVGVSTGIAYFDRPEGPERARVIWTSAALVLCTASILTFVALAGADRISQALFGTSEYAYPGALALLSVAASATSQPLVLGIQFRRHVRRYVWITAATASLGGALGLVLVGIFGRGLQGVLEAQLASQLALVTLAAREAWKAGTPRIDIRAARSLLQLGLPLVPSFYFLLVLQQGNQFLLKELRSLEELGVYVVGYNLGLVMSLIVSGFTTAWMPFFLSFSRDPESGRERLSGAMTYYVIAVGTLTLMFFVWSRPVVGLLAASPYHDAQIVVGYSAAAYFLVGVFSLLLPPLYYAKQVWAVTLIQGVGALAAVFLQTALIAQLGVLGAGIGLTAGFLLLCFLLYGWIRIHSEQYLLIPYKWGRIFAFGGLILLGAIAFSIPIRLSVIATVGWSLAASALTLGIAWTVLRSDERRTLAASARSVFAPVRT